MPDYLSRRPQSPYPQLYILDFRPSSFPQQGSFFHALAATQNVSKTYALVYMRTRDEGRAYLQGKDAFWTLCWGQVRVVWACVWWRGLGRVGGVGCSLGLGAMILYELMKNFTLSHLVPDN